MPVDVAAATPDRVARPLVVPLPESICRTRHGNSPSKSAWVVQLRRSSELKSKRRPPRGASAPKSSSVSTAPLLALLPRSAGGATSFGAEVGLPGGGPRRLLGEASPEPLSAGKTAGEVPTAVGFADRFGADSVVVAAAAFSARRGFSAAAATRSVVARAAVSAERSSAAGSDFLRFRRGGRLGS